MIRCFLVGLIVLAVVLNSCDTSRQGMGEGVIHFERELSTRLDFYTKPDYTTEPVFSVDLVYNSARTYIKTTLKKEGGLDFEPFYVSSGRSLLILQVMEQKGDWVKVITDDIKGVSHWLSKPQEKVEKWPHFLQSLFRVRPYDASRNPLRKSPNNNARLWDVNFSSTCFSVVDVQGDWIKVVNDPLKCPDEYIIESPFEGFLKWKDDGKILINFLL